MCDDGLIVLRTVQNLLDGNGPVFNAGERVEANTSTLWTYVLALGGLQPWLRLEWVAVVLGLLSALGGLFFGLDGARRLFPDRRIVPAGALVVLALPPFWDYATSGLETGLVTLWLSLVWWQLVRHATGGPVRIWPTLLLLGCGPLVRPEFALVSAITFAALVLVVRPGWRRVLGWLALTGLIPVAYQVFRMGYYGLITPNTALAKEATQARWDRGWLYLVELFAAYWLLVPVALLLVVAVLVLRDRDRTRLVVVLTPVVAGIVLGLYVTRVGGDYMHARMLLPVLTCLLLPVMVAPLTRWTTPLVLAVVAWTVTSAVGLRPVSAEQHKIGAYGISDARVFWVDSTGKEHPVTADDAALIPGYLPELAAARARVPGPVVVVSLFGTWVVYPATRTVISSPGALGFPGLLLPRTETVVDDLGLASPLAAHSLPIASRPAGHQKELSVAWMIADAGAGSPEELAAAGSAGNGVVSAEAIGAARKSLARPEIREMLDSVRAPLTFGRFWDNLVHSFGRSRLRFAPNPIDAQSGR
ncbi:arabinofuranosyltransferase [Amycolatopsis sp. NPDC048633]|uniref:arabinofuranosyltransferase n=1 Tax=Amycolatopsis sp. NPDC048633 TaxID=3157095 RepID=UPI0033FAA14B